MNKKIYLIPTHLISKELPIQYIINQSKIDKRTRLYKHNKSNIVELKTIIELARKYNASFFDINTRFRFQNGYIALKFYKDLKVKYQNYDK